MKKNLVFEKRIFVCSVSIKKLFLYVLKQNVADANEKPANIKCFFYFSIRSVLRGYLLFLP